MRASVIIPTYGSRLEYLRDTLSSLANQTYPSADFEVIVIDNGPGGNVRGVVDASQPAGSGPVRFIREDEPGLGKARHAGARAARGEILVYIDDDVTLPKEWLHFILEPYRSPEVGSTGGKVVLQIEAPTPPWFDHFSKFCLSWLDFGESTKELSWPNCVWGCNMSVRKSVLYEVGGFNPDFFGDKSRRWWTGDGECGLAQKIYQAGYKIVYEPKAWLHHRIPASRLTEKFYYDRFYITGIMASFTLIRQWGPGPFLSARLILNSLRYFLRSILKFVASVLKPKWRVRCKAYGYHWWAFAEHQLRAAFSASLREYIWQLSYL